MATIGELLSQFPLAMPPGRAPAAVNPMNPRQVAMVDATGVPPQAPVPFNPGGPSGVGGMIPPELHPGIRGKIGALFQNPDFNKSLMVFGANAMRTPQPGQNFGDTFGEALLAGMGTYEASKNQRKVETEKKAKDAEAAVQRQEDVDLKKRALGQGDAELAQRKDEANARFKEQEADRLSRENIARIQASARATRGTGGGTSAVEFAFGEAKKAYLSLGMTEDEAQQRAVKDVIVSQKTPSEMNQQQARYKSAVDIATEAWMRNPESLLKNPQEAATAIHQMALQLAKQSAEADSAFAVPPAGTPPLAPNPGTGGPTPTTEPAPIPPPARGGKGGPGQGTQSAPFDEAQAQAAANALRRPIKVWVVNPATGQAENVTVTPGAM